MFDRLAGLTREVGELDPSLLGVSSFASAIANYARFRAAVDAGWLRLLAEAEKARAAASEGMRTTADLVAALSGERRGSARADVALAATLGSRPAIREALAAGDLTKDKAAVLASIEALTPEQEASLVAEAIAASADGVRKLAASFKAEQGDDETPVVNSFTISKTPTSSRVVANLDPTRTAMLEAALEIAEAHMKLPKDIPFEQRRAEYLVAICKFFVENIEGATENRVGRPHVLAVVDFDVLEGRSQKLSLLGNGQVISASAARRLACDANVSRIITKGKSEILDVGRATRSWSAAMAKAIITRDRHCVHPGCEVPPWGCEIHHKEPYGDGHHGGVTSVGNGELRCWYHHDVVHRHMRNGARHSGDEECGDHRAPAPASARRAA